MTSSRWNSQASRSCSQDSPDCPLEGRVEDVELPLLVEMALHVGDVGMVAAVALLLVEDLEEHLQQRVSPRAMIGLAVDVEEDRVGGGGDDLLQVREEHGVGRACRRRSRRPAGVSPSWACSSFSSR